MLLVLAAVVTGLVEVAVEPVDAVDPVAGLVEPDVPAAVELVDEVEVPDAAAVAVVVGVLVADEGVVAALVVLAAVAPAVVEAAVVVPAVVELAAVGAVAPVVGLPALVILSLAVLTSLSLELAPTTLPWLPAPLTIALPVPA
jgi:hypothetical protein